jgi:hypothetical protein
MWSQKRLVLFNESHGLAQTRIPLLQALPSLRQAGFTHLAMETFTVGQGSTECPGSELADRHLVSRGAATRSSGYYTREALSAQIVRTAVELGFQLVAYDASEFSSEERHRRGATALACVLSQNHAARLVVLGGFGNVMHSDLEAGERPRLADELRTQTGIRPFVVDTVHLAGVPMADVSESSATLPGTVHALTDRNGEPVAARGADLSVWVAGSSERGDLSWLRLGPERVAVGSGTSCAGERLLLEARRPEDSLEVIPMDRCITGGHAASECTMHLPPGTWRIDARGTEAIAVCRSRLMMVRPRGG